MHRACRPPEDIRHEQGSFPLLFAPCKIIVDDQVGSVPIDVLEAFDLRRFTSLRIELAIWTSEDKCHRLLVQARELLLACAAMITELTIDSPDDLSLARSYDTAVSFPVLQTANLLIGRGRIKQAGLLVSIVENAPRLQHLRCTVYRFDSLITLLRVCGLRLKSLYLDFWHSLADGALPDLTIDLSIMLSNLTTLAFYDEAGLVWLFHLLRGLSSLRRLEVEHWRSGAAIEWCLEDDRWSPALQQLAVGRRDCPRLYENEDGHWGQIREICSRRDIQLELV